MNFKSDIRFKGIEPFDSKMWLSSPTMHGDEMEYVTKAYETNWMSTVGENINELEKNAAKYIGVKHAVALSSGTFGDYSCISFNGNKIITGSSGGMLLCENLDDANKARKGSTQSREAAPRYQHEEASVETGTKIEAGDVVHGFN